MSVTKTYTLNGMRQLVDLNGDLKNFKLTFHAASHCGSHFHAVVADQKTLDENATLEFRTAEGEISAEIVMDQDTYQNYFLVLKAKDNKTCKVDVLIDCQEIAPKPKPPPPPLSQQPQHNLKKDSHVPKNKETINWKMIIIVVTVLAGAALLYYLYTQNQKKGDNSSEPVVDKTLFSSSSPASNSPSVHSPAPSNPPVSNSPPATTINSSLLDRLKNLPMR